MKKYLKESLSADCVKINISELKNDFPELRVNDIRDTLIDNGAKVEGSEEHGTIYMTICNMPKDVVEDIFNLDYGTFDIEDYMIGTITDTDVDADLDSDYSEYPDYPDYDDVEVDDIADYPSYDDVIDEDEIYESLELELADNKLISCAKDIKEFNDLSKKSIDDQKSNIKKLKKLIRCAEKLESCIDKKLKECGEKELISLSKTLEACKIKVAECSEKLIESDTKLAEANCVQGNKLMKECGKTLEACCKKVNGCCIKLKECNESFENPYQKRTTCCPPRKRNLLEAMKAFKDEDQDKLKDIESNINDIKSNDIISEDDALEAIEKLKKELKRLEKIDKDENTTFSISDIRGIKTLLKKIADKAPADAKSIKKFLDKADAALKEGKRTLNDATKINGISLKDHTNEQLSARLSKLTKAASALNESASAELVDVFNKCIRKIEEELTYRAIYSMLNESEEDGSLSDEELKKMFGMSIEELTDEDNKEEESEKEEAKEESEEEAKEEESEEAEEESEEAESEEEEEESEEAEDEEAEDEEVYLSRIEITMASKEAAEDLKDACLEAEIPEDAIDIYSIDAEDEEESEDEEEESEEAESEEEESEDEEAEEETETEEAEESAKYHNIDSILNEAEEESEEAESDEEESEDEEAEEETETEEAEAEDESEDTNGKYIFALIDTDYAPILQNVLENVYGITKEEFEEKIGGEIVEQNSEESEDEEDEESEDDEIKPEDLFKGL